MKRTLFLLLILLTIHSVHCQNPINSVVPKPEIVVDLDGRFHFSESTRIIIDKNIEVFGIASRFAQFLYKSTGTLIVIDSTACTGSNIIRLILSDTAVWCADEGYQMDINPIRIIISAMKPAGIFYALQTLRQMMPPTIENPGQLKIGDIEIQACTILDRPRFSWRGMNLDCGRHFMEKEFVKRYIDLLAYHKMNVLHWHLTEDQGWRIEIKKYPKLTEIGAWRTEDDGTVYGGFYTQDDIREIVAYASERYITIVPEIEMPGHSLAALAAYPWLSCTGGPFQVEKSWGVFKDIYCAGNDSSFMFLEDVLLEVMDLFPSKYIHIGGDEAPKYRWDNCPKCQLRMKKENLHNGEELQSYFIERIEKFLNEHARSLIGWDEILEGGLAPSATVQSWRGFEGATHAAESGHDAIVSPTSHCYFDYDVSVTSFEKVYSFEPVPVGLDADKQHHILGGECNMWTEYAPQELIDSKVFPRICAMSEVLWSSSAGRNFGEFEKRMQTHYQRLNGLGVKYGYERKPVEISIVLNAEKNDFMVTLTPGQQDVVLYYTLDGSDPTSASMSYNAPFAMNGAAELKVKVFRPGGGDSPVFTRKVSRNIGLGKPYSITYPYHKNYVAGADTNLTNGLRGTGSFRDGMWQGYNGVDFEAIVNLESRTKIHRVSVGFLQSTLSWIFYPLKLEVLVSPDKQNWIKVGEVENTVPQTDVDITTKDFVVEFKPQDAVYVKVYAYAMRNCPDWHPGAGSKTWLFIDEIVVE